MLFFIEIAIAAAAGVFGGPWLLKWICRGLGLWVLDPPRRAAFRARCQ